ncbi:hypothetical protein EDB89DRAFT_1909597 [Lactarius sanguifluus]|nr:hypothetical protein EDB89DRAFT_1909597 [Lactarius sanguifluus]
MSCLFGSAASYLWADIGRIPTSVPTSHPKRPTQDIDIVLWDEDEFSTPRTSSSSLSTRTDRYYLEPSKRPKATYEILYCRLPGWRTDPDWRRIKVDILVAPGDLGLPKINSYKQDWIAGIPVMPLFALLVMKTKGWWDHRISSRSDFRAKERADLTDIDALLDRALKEKVSYQVEKYKYTSKFTRRGITHACKIVRIYDRPGKWRRLEFPLNTSELGTWEYPDTLPSVRGTRNPRPPPKNDTHQRQGLICDTSEDPGVLHSPWGGGSRRGRDRADRLPQRTRERNKERVE